MKEKETSVDREPFSLTRIKNLGIIIARHA